MISVSVTALKQNIYNIIAKVNDDHMPINITNGRGKGAVLIGEDDWVAIKESIYLMDVPGMTESLLAGKSESAADCVSEDDLNW